MGITDVIFINIFAYFFPSVNFTKEIITYFNCTTNFEWMQIANS